MKKGAWITISLFLAAVSFLILLGAGRDLAPTEKWVARYNGPGNKFDGGWAIAVDGAGNVYVTGESAGSGTQADFTTIKYNINGKQIWVKRYNGPGNARDIAADIAVDGSGNVYITGYSEGSGTEYDYATIKYNTNGKQIWIRRYNGPGNGIDEAGNIAVDVSGNVYVTGISWSTGIHATFDFATIKYDMNGAQLWVRRYNGPPDDSDCPQAIAVDDTGNVYVTGGEGGISVRKGDFATIKYGPDGKELWIKRYNGPDNGPDFALCLALDGFGNVYIAGASRGLGTYFDYATIKYNTNGKRLWVQRLSVASNSFDMPRALAVDGSGNVYVTGQSRISDYNYDYLTVKYDTNGKQLWVKRYNGPASGMDEAVAIALDGAANVFITGWSEGSNSNSDFATIKYNSNGQQIWIKRYNGPGNGFDAAADIAVDGAGHVYITGESKGSGTDIDVATIKY